MSATVQRAALLLVLVLGLAACQVDIEVGIGFNEDGSGLVTVDVALDQEAVALAPDITSLLLIDDIEDLRPQNEMDEVGHAVFFAAIEPHAALPVKEGVRDSLTVWFSEGSGR